MRTEERIGRPFTVAPKLAHLCRGVILETPSGRDIEGDETNSLTVDWDSNSLEHFGLKILFDYDEICDDAENQGLDPDDLEIAVIGVLPILRRTVIINQVPLSSLDAGVLEIDLRTQCPTEFLDALLTNCGASVSAYLTLGKTIEKKGSNPHFGSTWLSRSRFTFGKHETGYGFALAPLTDLQFDSGVAKKAQSYVEIKGSLVSAVQDDLDLTIYVNKDLLNQLATVDQPISKGIKLKLEYEAISELLTKLAKDCSGDQITEWDQLPKEDGQVGATLVQNIAKVMKLTDEEVFSKLVSDDIQIILTYLQSELKLLEADLDALVPKESEGD